MADSYLQELFAERIGGNKFGKDTTIYKFEKIKRAKRAAKAAHPDVELIDMGVGEPDDMAFPEVVAALAVEAGKIENRFYSDNGCMEFRIAVQKYMKELYGVDLDPETEIVHSIGSTIDWKNSPWYRQYLRDYVRSEGSLFFDAEKVLKSPEIPTAKDLFRYDYVDVVASEKNGNEAIRMDDVCRSHSIWLDPIDAPKELYKWRLRVQKAICWAYLNDCVPVMMTLTIYHRWDNLDGLIRVLQNSWDKFLVSGRPAQKRQAEMDLVGNIRRLEITINDGDENFSEENGKPDTNAGWHPHFHVLLFVPKDKFGTVSDMEPQMKKDWAEIVAEKYSEEFGKEIEASFMPALEKYGLYLSRYNKGVRKGELRPVKDSAYFAKIMGYDPANVYGGDKEVTSDVFKNSKIPFDLLCEVTATNIDLWCEYAIATKGMASLRISKPLAKKINEYFIAHPDKDPIPKDLPPSKVVAHLEHTIYRLFYRNFLIPQLKAKAAEGFEALSRWVKDKMVELGVSALCDDPTALPRPPNSVDDLLSKKILPSP